jgi:outer membrane protein, heavy metal efflux system
MKILIIPFVFLMSLNAFAQKDTLKLSLENAENTFLDKNLQLIANKLNIEESKAYEIQAKLRPNPNLYVEQMPYNSQKKEIVGLKQSNSEQIVQFQQLFLLAQKRQKQFDLAQANTELTGHMMEELLRNLKFQLRSSFYDVYYYRQAINLYNIEIAKIQETLNLYQSQFEKGNIPLKDMNRLRAYLISLNTEKQGIASNYIDAQHDLGILLNLPQGLIVEPQVTPNEGNSDKLIPDFKQLFDLALANRPDMKIADSYQNIANRNLKLQEALKTPDLNMHLNFDRNGSFIPNYVGIGADMTLPIFNKNQGNIQAAKIRVLEANKGKEITNQTITKDIESSLDKALQSDKLLKSFDLAFTSSFTDFIDGVIKNYEKRNIDVVEFIDFFDSYKGTILQINQLEHDRKSAFEGLNFTVGTTIFN